MCEGGGIGHAFAWKSSLSSDLRGFCSQLVLVSVSDAVGLSKCYQDRNWHRNLNWFWAIWRVAISCPPRPQKQHIQLTLMDFGQWVISKNGWLAHKKSDG